MIMRWFVYNMVHRGMILHYEIHPLVSHVEMNGNKLNMTYLIKGVFTAYMF